MSPLRPLANAPFPYFVRIVDSKQERRRKRLRRLRHIVNARYDEFSNSVNHLENLRANRFSETQKTDLQHCYLVKTTELNNLKSEIINYQKENCPEALSICQYCGLTHSPDDFDHYLPKEEFPELSVCALNLVPACATCNREKGEAWLDASGTRRVVSFYYDQLPTTQFLRAEIRMDDPPTASFFLSQNSSDYGAVERLIRNHFEKLKLLDRFADGAAAIIAEARNEISDLPRPATRAEAAGLILDSVRKLLLTYSPNYWKIPLRQAMASNNKFLDFCLQVVP